MRVIESEVRTARPQHVHEPPPWNGAVAFDRRAAARYSLSDRELSVLYLLIEGLADKQIAASLGVTTYTVNKHVGSILVKMNVRSRTGAAVRAVRDQIFAWSP